MWRSLVRLIFQIIVALIPWIWRFIRLAFFLAITSISSIYVGVPTAVKRIADNWIEQATAAGLTLGYYPALRSGAMVVASITLILGWLVLASLTVWIVNIVF